MLLICPFGGRRFLFKHILQEGLLLDSMDKTYSTLMLLYPKQQQRHLPILGSSHNAISIRSIQKQEQYYHTPMYNTNSILENKRGLYSPNHKSKLVYKRIRACIVLLETLSLILLYYSL